MRRTAISVLGSLPRNSASTCRSPNPTAIARAFSTTWWFVTTSPRVASTTNPEPAEIRSEEHTSELQSLMRISYAVVSLKKKTHIYNQQQYCIYQSENTNNKS